MGREFIMNGEKKNADRILMAKSKGNRSLRRYT
jgi:hypothetical protein